MRILTLNAAHFTVVMFVCNPLPCRPCRCITYRVRLPYTEVSVAVKRYACLFFSLRLRNLGFDLPSPSYLEHTCDLPVVYEDSSTLTALPAFEKVIMFTNLPSVNRPTRYSLLYPVISH